MGLRPRLLSAARTLVVSTAALPGLRQAYRAIYAMQTRRVGEALRGIEGVTAVLLRGSPARAVAAGLSDIDLVVVLDDTSGPERELTALERVYQAVRRVNRVAPLVRDVHAFTGRELAALARLHAGLYGGILWDTQTIDGAVRLPEIADSPTLARETLARELCFWSLRSVHHLVDDGRVGRGLAARAHAKAASALLELERGARSTRGLWQAIARGDRHPVGYRDLFELIARADAALPEAPLLTNNEVRAPHPSLDASHAAVEQWLAPFERAPGVMGALLSVEGARENDLRAYVVVDPREPRLPETLSALGRRGRRVPFPRERFSRFPSPQVVTETQLARSVLLRWTGGEPVARQRHGVVLFGKCPEPRATWEEIARAVVLDFLHATSQVREGLARGSLSSREALRLRDVLLGLMPALEALATSGEILTRYAPRERLDVRPGALPPNVRLMCIEQIGMTLNGPVARLLDRVGTPAAESSA